MINLPSPLTIQPPSITRNDEVRVQDPITITGLDVTILDSSRERVCAAKIEPCPFPLVLWSAEAYDIVGDYTQAQAEARVMELLGSDIKSGLEALFAPPQA